MRSPGQCLNDWCKLCVIANLPSRTHFGSQHVSYASDCFVVAIEEEPVSFKEAQNSRNWMAAMHIEYDAIVKNGTWPLCDLPPGKKAIGTNWVYKLKRKPDGSVDHYKTKLVAKGLLSKRALILMRPLLPLAV